ncbi:hypothetical protein PHYPSEUDO_010509 [Phytophthora pseudosyringae]|uniref:RxLR effector protein n=1 Tax=Phytophthora pseudosyringae TaxID=221518 RepID=A0A8T1W7X0_9STRA|nr:hypothetical protein PHYPSEUDO_010509 [Phytophthora pseudosyringae]
MTEAVRCRVATSTARLICALTSQFASQDASVQNSSGRRHRSKEPMRLSYILLLAAAALVGTLDGTEASGAALSKLKMANAVGLANAHESTGNGRRSLRVYKEDNVDDDDDDVDDDDEKDYEEEERMFSLGEKFKALQAAAKFSGKSTDDMSEVLKKLGPDEINAMFNQGESQIKKALPGFYKGMGAKDFDKLIRGLPDEQQALLLSGYSKYLHYNGGL